LLSQVVVAVPTTETMLAVVELAVIAQVLSEKTPVAVLVLNQLLSYL
jgi:hypothetical protein